MPVAVVTDSTAYLPSDLEGRCTVVPLTVVLGDRQGREGLDITIDEVAKVLSAGQETVTTSRPASAEFTETYDALLSDGHSAVLSVHLCGKLSGTVAAAAVAAREFGDRVHVVDSGSVAMGLGFPVMAAIEAAGAGCGPEIVRGAAQAAIARTTTLFYVDTLEFLRRGGRIGAAAALLGTALAVKPILHVTGDGIVVSDRVRTVERALARLTQFAIRAGGAGDVSVAVHHLGEPDRAQTTADALAVAFGGRLRRMYVAEVGAAVGAHTGPGLLGIVVHADGDRCPCCWGSSSI